MSKFVRVLNEQELSRIFEGMGYLGGHGTFLDIANEVQQAVQEKLAEQEPVAWRVHPFDYGVGVEGAYAITQQEDQMQAWINRGWDVTPLYAHPIPETKEHHRTAKNHIADARKIVAEMYWINPDYPSSDSLIEAFEPVTSDVEIEVGEQYEVSRAIRLPDMRVEVTELEENGDVKSYKVLRGGHITEPDLD